MVSKNQSVSVEDVVPSTSVVGPVFKNRLTTCFDDILKISSEMLVQEQLKTIQLDGSISNGFTKNQTKLLTERIHNFHSILDDLDFTLKNCNKFINKCDQIGQEKEKERLAALERERERKLKEEEEAKRQEKLRLEQEEIKRKEKEEEEKRKKLEEEEEEKKHKEEEEAAATAAAAKLDEEQKLAQLAGPNNDLNITDIPSSIQIPTDTTTNNNNNPLSQGITTGPMDSLELDTLDSGKDLLEGVNNNNNKDTTAKPDSNNTNDLDFDFNSTSNLLSVFDETNVMNNTNNNNNTSANNGTTTTTDTKQTSGKDGQNTMFTDLDSMDMSLFGELDNSSFNTNNLDLQAGNNNTVTATTTANINNNNTSNNNNSNTQAHNNNNTNNADDNLLGSMQDTNEDYLTLNDFNDLNIDWNTNNDTRDMFNI